MTEIEPQFCRTEFGLPALSVGQRAKHLLIRAVTQVIRPAAAMVGHHATELLVGAQSKTERT
jgi:hypothetical protein